MRRILSFLTALCLLFLCASALAETATETLVETDDFTLTLESGAQYQESQSEQNMPFLMVFPYAASGDTGSNITIAKALPYLVSAALVKPEYPQMESTMREQYAAQGITLNTISFTDPEDTTLNGKDCVYYSIEAELDYMSMSIPLYQGIYQIGSYSYTISVNATTKETLVSLIQLLNSSLKWK